MELHQKNPKIKTRMTTFHKKGTHTKAERREKEKPNKHLETVKRGLSIIGKGLAKLGSEENREKIAKLGRNAGKMTREKQFTGFGLSGRKSKKSRGIFDI